MNDLNLSMATTTVPYNNNYGEYASNVINTITNDVLAEINEYDLSSNFATPTASLEIRDFAANLLDKDLFPYLDFSLPCWNANFVKNNTVNGNLFYAVGDIGTTTVDSAIVMWYNEELYNNNRESRDPENLQELAIEGFWTYETLFDWTNRLYLDLDGLPGITADDTFALIAPEKSSYCASAFASAWDISFVKENGNNTHTFSIDIPALKYAVDCYKELLSAYGTTTDSTAKKFANGNSLFYIGRLDDGYRNGSELRESELMSMAACSMLPMPKFNMDQESYKTALAGEHSLLLALNHDDYRSGVALSAFLQYSTELWSKEIKPYYIESHILLKHLTHTGDQHARTSAILYDMLDNIDFDYENVYSSQLGNVTNFWNQVLTSSQEISTLYNSHKSNYESAISDTDAWFKSK